MSPKNLSYGHLMKIEWLIADVTAVGSPTSTRAESAVFCVILDVFWPLWATLVAGEPLCDLETPS